MVITNAITFLSYLSICVTLFYMVRNTRRVIVREWAYFAVGFALFIVACGSTHLLEVITTWVPVFWLDAWTNIITAGLSACVAIMLIRRAAKISFGINDYAGRLGNAENERLRMQESLVAAQKLEDWSRMSAAVSHEIRGPLEAIQNLQYLIQNTKDVPPEILELAHASAEEAGRVLTISQSTLLLHPAEQDAGACRPMCRGGFCPDHAGALDSRKIGSVPCERSRRLCCGVVRRGDPADSAERGPQRM